ncbi:hypothetical protein Hanom_Chr13g01192561 [Helianthus anomalus]
MFDFWLECRSTSDSFVSVQVSIQVSFLFRVGFCFGSVAAHVQLGQFRSSQTWSTVALVRFGSSQIWSNKQTPVKPIRFGVRLIIEVRMIHETSLGWTRYTSRIYLSYVVMLF